MDFYCLVPSEKSVFHSSIDNTEARMVRQPIEKTISSNKFLEVAFMNMAVNHSITSIRETGEIVGDPMEIKLFEFGEYEITHDHEHDPEVIFEFGSKRGHHGVVLKRFDFDSQLFRMSTIAKSNITGEDCFIYTKGSPEAMLKIFRPESVPKDYEETLKEYASHGFRVLAIGSRRIKEEEFKAERLEVERDLEFNGFEVFENRLKPETKEGIKNLHDAEIPTVMITGDNALTGSNISLECKIADTSKKMYIYDYKENKLVCEKFNYNPK